VSEQVLPYTSRQLCVASLLIRSAPPKARRDHSCRSRGSINGNLAGRAVALQQRLSVPLVDPQSILRILVPGPVCWPPSPRAPPPPDGPGSGGLLVPPTRIVGQGPG